jgi:chemotaxis methyl-accepting protein methylase
MVERRILQRFGSTKCENATDYLHYLQKTPDELDNLIDVLTINVSRFFRDAMTFEYIARRILPAIAHQKKMAGARSLRVWSNGCAMGQEPYSVAILIHDFIKQEALKLDVNIFATDIDTRIIKKAQTAVYPSESMKNVKYRWLKKYFLTQGKSFHLIPEIRDLVLFSCYDILDKNSYVPPESIFGSFDMVLCRNVLIYFDMTHQNKIFEKLYRALTKHGYLILGDAEMPSAKYRRYFKQVNDCCHIYQKR